MSKEPEIEATTDGGEYEREPVPAKAQKGQGAFWGMYAGEHAAGTEFMIGPLFLAAGASLKDLMFGLLLGNLLAVLTWRYLVLPIAMNRRLTLYYQLEKIAGGSLVKCYNVINGVLFCFLAGAMITVSASAIGVPFNVRFEVPENIFGFASGSFTLIVAIVGTLIALVAAAGYNMVSRVANIAAPWMILVFAMCGIVSLAQMSVHDFAGLEKVWNQGVGIVQKANGVENFGFWKIVIFAWLCNGAMHFGMADLSIFRFAKTKSAGWAPSIGMFLGHYMAWICAALMLAAVLATQPQAAMSAKGTVQADPGFLAYNALGWTGIICVVIAGWTTANPTIYRAGLAFQSLFARNAKAYLGVLVAGVIATVAGAFPNLSGKLLGFVGTYGTVLGPMGAIIFVNHYCGRAMGFISDAAEAKRSSFNLAVLLAWLIPVIPALYLIFYRGQFAAYCVIPAWIAAGVLYAVLAKILHPARG